MRLCDEIHRARVETEISYWNYFMEIPYGFENTFFCIDRDNRALVLKRGVEAHNKPLKVAINDLI